MKLTTSNTADENNANTQTGSAARNNYAASCQKVIAQINAAREAILAESRALLDVPERLLRLAVTEAEAVAWQTTYPHLVFPVLATEKVQAITHWDATQRNVRRGSPVFVGSV